MTMIIFSCVGGPENSIKTKTFQEFVTYAEKFSEAIDDLMQNQQSSEITFFTKPYSAKDIVMRLFHISLLTDHYLQYKDTPYNFAIETEGKICRKKYRVQKNHGSMVKY